MSLDAVTLTQMRYALALEDTCSFSQAAKKCHVTQSTLSLQIQKLEELLDVEIFDRSRKPLIPTSTGHKLLRVFESVRESTDNIPYLLHQSSSSLMGRMRLGLIPTVSQALTPLLAQHFVKLRTDDHAEDLRLTLIDLQTTEILSELKSGSLDAAILADTPSASWLESRLLYEEEFLVYTHPDHMLAKKTSISSQDLDPNEVWLLKDGHCFGTQALGLCAGDRTLGRRSIARFQYDAGSFESLTGIVDKAGGYTLLPWSYCFKAGLLQSPNIKHFQSPIPVRTVHYIFRKDSIKGAIHSYLQQLCLQMLPKQLVVSDGLLPKWQVPYFER